MSRHVRITLEGELLQEIDQQIDVFTNGVTHTFGPRVRASKGFKLEEIEAPLAVGDRVDSLGSTRPPFGTIIHIHETQAWVRWDSPGRAGGIWYLSTLRRAE
jgi:hypothetical protein